MEKINHKLRLSKQKLTSLPFRKIAPNIVTMLALCAGVTSIRYSIAENWAMAVICIFLAAFFDGLDGRVARMLKGSTKFGAELDSLSDFVSFGVAPAILMFQWTLFDLPKFGWFFCLLFAIGMSMRLARFNTMLDEDPQPEYWHHFFVGVPAPAACQAAHPRRPFRRAAAFFPGFPFSGRNPRSGGIFCATSFYLRWYLLCN